MKTSPLPFDSEALRANLANTAQEVVIPDRYLPLLDAVDGLHGVRAALAETMGEYFHTFRNAELLVDGFQTTLLRNWPYFERSEEREKLFGLLAELVVGLLQSGLTSGQFSLLLRALLSWSTDVLGGRYPDQYDRALDGLADAFGQLLAEHEAAFLERDTLVRNLVRRAAARPSLEAGFFALYRQMLAAGYRRIREHLDVPAWALTQGEGLTDPGAVAEQFRFLTGRRVATCEQALEVAPQDKLLGASFPLFSTVVGEAIDALFRVEKLEDRFAVCLFFLKDETLGYRQKEVMADLLGVVKQMMEPDRHADAVRILARLTEFFRERDNEFLLIRFACYEAIGVAIGEAGNVRAADHLIEDILYWKLPVSRHPGATDEWETVVNPYPPAQDPLLDAHHRVESGLVRAAGRRPQRAAASSAACSSPTPTSSSATSPASSTPTSSPSTSSPSSCCARCRCTSTRSARRASCAPCPRRSTRSAAGGTR